MDIVFKTCKSCGRSLPLSDFWNDPLGKFRKKSQCKACLEAKKIRKPQRLKIHIASEDSETRTICGIEGDPGSDLTEYTLPEDLTEIPDNLCKKCIDKFLRDRDSDLFWANIRLVEAREHRRQNRRLQNRRLIEYCAVCGAAFNSYHAFRQDRTTCSWSCEAERERAVSFRGIKGFNQTELYHLTFSTRSISELGPRHEAYKMCCIAVRYLEMTRARIDLKNGMKEKK